VVLAALEQHHLYLAHKFNMLVAAVLELITVVLLVLALLVAAMVEIQMAAQLLVVLQIPAVAAEVLLAALQEGVLEELAALES
jgi:hypothetical protein